MKALLRILRRLLQQPGIILAAFMLTVGQCILKLRLPALMADMINSGVMHGDTGYILAIGRNMAVVCVFMAVCDYGGRLLCIRSGQRLALKLRTEAYSRLMAQTVDRIQGLGSASLITRLTVDAEICAGLPQALVLLLAEPLLMVVGGILMMWRIAPVLGMVFAIFVALQLALLTLFIRMTVPGFFGIRAATDILNGRLQQVFSGFRLMKLSGTEQEERECFGEGNHLLFSKTLDVQRKIALFNPLMMLLMNLALACILYQSGIQITIGRIGLGDLLAAISYGEQALLSVVAGGRLYQILMEAQPSAGRLFEILDLESDPEESAGPLNEGFREIEFRDVHLRYPDGTVALTGLSFHICSGETLAVIGPIGSGKSSLAGLCAKLRVPDEGDVLLNGKNITSLRGTDVRRVIALVEKQTAVLQGSLRENIIFGREGITEEDIRCALRAAQLEDYAESRQGGLDGFIPAGGKGLSGGERQRLTIARALAGRPGLLLLDDSTSCLDYQTERNLLKAVRTVFPHIAILQISNRIVCAEEADRILVLESGRIAAEGTDKVLRKKSPLYRRM